MIVRRGMRYSSVSSTSAGPIATPGDALMPFFVIISREKRGAASAPQRALRNMPFSVLTKTNFEQLRNFVGGFGRVGPLEFQLHDRSLHRHQHQKFHRAAAVRRAPVT